MSMLTKARLPELHTFASLNETPSRVTVTFAHKIFDFVSKSGSVPAIGSAAYQGLAFAHKIFDFVSKSMKSPLWLQRNPRRGPATRNEVPVTGTEFRVTPAKPVQNRHRFLDVVTCTKTEVLQNSSVSLKESRRAELNRNVVPEAFTYRKLWPVGLTCAQPSG